MWCTHAVKPRLTPAEYVVLDVELEGPATGKWALAEAQVARKSDFGRNDTIFFTRTHLGNLLKPGAVWEGRAWWGGGW